MNQKYYTTSQAAELLSVSPDTVLKWVRRGKIDSYITPGGHARIPAKAIETMLPAPAETAVTAPPYHFCWEFHGLNGTITEDCEACVVYRSRARRCYEMRDIPEQFGYLKLHCTTDCRNCAYYREVVSQATTVLVLTRNQRLHRMLEAESAGADIPIRFARSEYEFSAAISEFRPDYIVLDGAFGAARIRELCCAVSRDERIPFSKIILTSENEDIKDCYDGRIFGWIKKPFSFRELRCCLGQAE